jgi:hypothetical protein
MSEARTTWYDVATRQKVAANRQRSGILVAVGLLVAMTAAEVLFLTYAAGPDTVDLLTAGQGAPIGGE